MDPKQYASFFAEQGYLVLTDLLDKSAVDTSHQEIDRLHQIALRLLDNDQLNGSDYQLSPMPRQIGPMTNPFYEKSKIRAVIHPGFPPSLRIALSCLLFNRYSEKIYFFFAAP